MPDKKSVKEWLEEIAYGNAKLWSAFYSDTDSKELANSTLALLKEQEPVSPNWMQNENGIWNTCKRCGYILKSAILDKEPEKQKMFFYFPKFCSECGQAVKWK